MTKLMILTALVALPAASLAQPPRGPTETGYDPYASAAIERADFTRAEQRLERRLAEDPDDVSAMLNLAYVMGSTSRVAAATFYYELVLSADNELVAGRDGEREWSHDLARRGMALAPPMASR